MLSQTNFARSRTRGGRGDGGKVALGVGRWWIRLRWSPVPPPPKLTSMRMGSRIPSAPQEVGIPLPVAGSRPKLATMRQDAMGFGEVARAMASETCGGGTTMLVPRVPPPVMLASALDSAPAERRVGWVGVDGRDEGKGTKEEARLAERQRRRRGARGDDIALRNERGTGRYGVSSHVGQK